MAKGGGNHLVSLRRVEQLLGRGRVELQALAEGGRLLYRPFHQHNLETGKERHIDNPARELKVVQRAIDRRILSMWMPPPGMFGGVRGCTVADNARLHAGSAVVVTVDVEKYFPSVDNRQVYGALLRLVGCSTVAALLTRLTTVNFHLPHGAPTSTTLANMVMEPTFLEISERAGQIGVRVSSWLDDFTFSGTRAREAIEIAYDAFGRLGLRINRKKTSIMRTERAAQETTGVVVNREPSLGRARMRECRLAIRAAKTGPVSRYQLERIRGQRAFAAMVNPDQASALERLAEGLPEHGAPGGEPPPPRVRYGPCPPECDQGRGMPRPRTHIRAA